MFLRPEQLQEPLISSSQKVRICLLFSTEPPQHLHNLRTSVTKLNMTSNVHLTIADIKPSNVSMTITVHFYDDPRSNPFLTLTSL